MSDPASGARTVDVARPRRRWTDLPQPLHLFVGATRTRHFHLGCFDEPGIHLEGALDRLVERVVPFLGCGPVLDLGCGLGGTATMLARHGFDVIGADPCPERIAFARRCTPVRLPVRFFCATAERLAATHAPHAFGALVLIEVMQHFPLPDVLVHLCRRLLAPGGTVCILDVGSVPALAWERVPFHRRGAVAAAFTRAGFRTLWHGDMTGVVLPTFSALSEALTAQTPRLVRVLAHRSQLALEVAELQAQLGNLHAAMSAGELAYECLVLQSRP